MSYPFSPTRITFNGFGRDDRLAHWVRFRTDAPDNRFFMSPLPI